MDYTTVVDFVDEENNKGWITSDEEKFQPYSLSFSYIPTTKTFYYWKNRISVAPGLNFSVVADLIRPTNSYLVFSPSLSFKLNEFLTLTFSSTSRIPYYSPNQCLSLKNKPVKKTKVTKCVRAQSCQILFDPMDCSLPGSSVHGIFRASILERVAISPSRGSS